MSQCKCPRVVSLTAPGAFTHVFGDLDPDDTGHARAMRVSRSERPAALRASTLARLPPLASAHDLVSDPCGLAESEVEA